MRGYQVGKLEHLIALEAPPSSPVLAYLLQETHISGDCPLLGTPAGYTTLTLPSPSPTSHEGCAILLHPSAILRWSHTSHTALAATIRWGSLQLHLITTYVPPLTAPHRARLLTDGLLSTEGDSLVDLDALLSMVPCATEPVIVLGDLNARTGSHSPSLPHHPPRDSADPVTNTRGRALLALACKHGLILLNGTTPALAAATSFS